ncbi:hypothetical protein U9W91_001961 [Enterobacter hormaechei]
MKYIEELIQVILTKHNVKGTHTFSCTTIEKDDYYLLLCSTEIEGKKSGVSLPITKELYKSLSLPTEDFELTVTV